MRKSTINVGLIVLMAISLIACSAQTRERFGAGLGLAVGGLLGSKAGTGNGKALATAGGVIAGGLLGREAGRRTAASRLLP